MFNTLIEENNATSQTQKEQELFTAWRKSKYEKECTTNQLNEMQRELEEIQKSFNELHNKYIVSEKSVAKDSIQNRLITRQTNTSSTKKNWLQRLTC